MPTAVIVDAIRTPLGKSSATQAPRACLPREADAISSRVRSALDLQLSCCSPRLLKAVSQRRVAQFTAR